jgi:transcriptional regulator with XRE-family HTH domain
MNAMTDEIRKAARDAMEREGISSYKLAELTGIEQPNITRLLTGRSGSVPKNWAKVLDALGLVLVAVPKGTDLSKLTKED